MAGLLKCLHFLSLAGLLLGTSAMAANVTVLYSRHLGVLSPDTIAVAPGDNITWTTDSSCTNDLDPCSFYRVIVVYKDGTQAGGPFNVGSWEGDGFWCETCGGPISYGFPTSPHVVADVEPGNYPYFVLAFYQGFPGGSTYGTIKILGSPTAAIRRSWGELKLIYR